MEEVNTSRITTMLTADSKLKIASQAPGQLNVGVPPFMKQPVSRNNVGDENPFGEDEEDGDTKN